MYSTFFGPLISFIVLDPSRAQRPGKSKPLEFGSLGRFSGTPVWQVIEGNHKEINNFCGWFHFSTIPFDLPLLVRHDLFQVVMGSATRREIICCFPSLKILTGLLHVVQPCGRSTKNKPQALEGAVPQFGQVDCSRKATLERALLNRRGFWSLLFFFEGRLA